MEKRRNTATCISPLRKQHCTVLTPQALLHPTSLYISTFSSTAHPGTFLNCILLLCTDLYFISLYCTVFYFSVLQCILLLCTTLSFTNLHCTELYPSALHRPLGFCTALKLPTMHNSVLYHPVLHCMLPARTANSFLCMETGNRGDYPVESQQGETFEIHFLISQPLS